MMVNNPASGESTLPWSLSPPDFAVFHAFHMSPTRSSYCSCWGDEGGSLVPKPSPGVGRPGYEAMREGGEPVPHM